MVCDVFLVWCLLNWCLLVKLLCKCCLVLLFLIIKNFYGWELIEDVDSFNVLRIVVRLLVEMCLFVLYCLIV